MEIQLLISGKIDDIRRIQDFIHNVEIAELAIKSSNQFGEGRLPQTLFTDEVLKNHPQESPVPDRDLSQVVSSKQQTGEPLRISCWHCRKVFLTLNRHKKYCSPRCSADAWNKARYNAVKQQITCPTCGKLFMPVNSRQKYCSHTCYNKAYKAEKFPKPTSYCLQCGKETQPNRGWSSKYCSLQCCKKYQQSIIPHSVIPDPSPVQAREFSIPDQKPIIKSTDDFHKKLEHLKKTGTPPVPQPNLHREF